MELNKELQDKIDELAKQYFTEGTFSFADFKTNANIILSSREVLKLAGLYTKEQVREEVGKAIDEFSKGELHVWNGVESELLDVSSIEDARDVYNDYMQEGEIHPDIESITILREIGYIKIEETDEEINGSPVCTTEIIVLDKQKYLDTHYPLTNKSQP